MTVTKGDVIAVTGGPAVDYELAVVVGGRQSMMKAVVLDKVKGSGYRRDAAREPVIIVKNMFVDVVGKIGETGTFVLEDAKAGRVKELVKKPLAVKKRVSPAPSASTSTTPAKKRKEGDKGAVEESIALLKKLRDKLWTVENIKDGAKTTAPPTDSDVNLHLLGVRSALNRLSPSDLSHLSSTTTSLRSDISLASQVYSPSTFLGIHEGIIPYLGRTETTTGVLNLILQAGAGSLPPEFLQSIESLLKA